MIANVRRLGPVGITVAALLVLCTVWFAVGTDGKDRPARHPRGDAGYHYNYLPSLWLDGDLDFANQYQVKKNWYKFADTKLGRPGNVFGIGPAVFESPVFLAAHGVALASGARDDGFSDLEQSATGWLSVLVSVLALVFPARIAARRLGAARPGLIAAVLIFVGGPVIYYAVRRAGGAHPFATFFVAWLIDAWDSSHDRPRTLRTWLGLGALLGCSILARPQLAPWGLLLVAAGVADLRAARAPGERPRVALRLALALAVVFVCVLPQLLAWRAIYGEWWLVPQGEGFLRWDAPAWSETIFSSRGGLFPWSPLYAVGFVGMVIGLGRAPRLFGALLGGFLAQALVNGAAYDWWAGGGFPGRRFDSTFVAFALGLAVVLTEAVRAWRARGALRRALGAATLAACATLAIGGLAMAASHDPLRSKGKGGKPAATTLRARLGPPGEVIALASELSNLPARATFAWRHDTGLGAYDRVVGVHWLGDTYPGLNSRPPRTETRVPVMRLDAATRRGFVRHDRTLAELPGGRGRLLIGLNRRTGVELTVVASHPAGGVLRLSWNGREVASGELAEAGRAIIVRLDEVIRGTNQLAFDGPPGTRIEPITLRALGPY